MKSDQTNNEILEVHLLSKPADFKIPNKFEDRLKFEETENILKFQGTMSLSMCHRLKKLSDDPVYKEEIVEIFHKLHSGFNLGLLFVTAFRWMLLLLFALTLQKIVDGLCFKLSNETIFSDMKLLIFPANILQKIPIGGIEWNYFIGIMQFAVTILFAIRYFGCLVDPIWRGGINMDWDKTKYSLPLYLKKVPVKNIIEASMISLIEFVIVYHVSVSLSHVGQWLNFLLLLVIVDISYFLFRPLLNYFPNSIKYIGFFILGIFESILFFIPYIFVFILKITIGFFSNTVKKILLEILNREKKLADWIASYKKDVGGQFGEIWENYAGWALVDLSSIVMTLILYSKFSTA